MSLAYKLIDRQAWAAAVKDGVFTGSEVDILDGFIHLSAAHQAAETARRYFSGHVGLLLVAVDTNVLGDILRWEPSRGGDLFPHVYGPMPTAAAVWTRVVPLEPDGTPILGDLP